MERIEFGIKTNVQPALRDFVNELVPSCEGEERRESKRSTLYVEVFAVAVDDNFIPTREAFVAMSRDISEDGLSLFYTEALATGLYALEFPNERQSVVKVVRCREVGPFFEAGASFVAHLE